MDERWRETIFRAIDGDLSSGEFEQLQQALEQDESLMDEYLRAAHLSASLEDLSSEGASSSLGDGTAAATPKLTTTTGRRPSLWSRLTLGWAIAASIVIGVGGFAAWWERSSRPTETASNPSSETEQEETLINGHAALRNGVDLEWVSTGQNYRIGDVIPPGMLQLRGGLAEIDFFCGATVIVEGPAKLEVESDWSVRVHSGRLRAQVPPAARGFTVKAAETDIIDLGTEFAVEVGSESARVEVIDGEVELRGEEFDGTRLTTGERTWLKGDASSNVSRVGVSTGRDLQQRRTTAEADRYQQWQESVQQAQSDERLLAYYPIADQRHRDLLQQRRVVSDVASTQSVRDGHLIGPVELTAGRFGSNSVGLSFARPGARLRTRIDGEFSALTMMAWVKIDSLRHRYNAIFMGDGYENGEPHWQLRDDGRMMFSIMVDDQEIVEFYNPKDKKMVRDAGRHRVYFSPPISEILDRGQWVHLAAVYDPQRRNVRQYVNGVEVANEAIQDRFFVDTLRIGPAEIGNWGQPFRSTPWFAVRNLDGTIDELSIWDAALSAEEIQQQYDLGKPLGY